MGGGPCVIIIGDTGDKAQAIYDICQNDLLAKAETHAPGSFFHSRALALQAALAACVADAQDIALTFK